MAMCFQQLGDQRCEQSRAPHYLQQPRARTKVYLRPACYPRRLGLCHAHSSIYQLLVKRSSSFPSSNMVATPSMLAGFAALALAAINGVSAAPLELNPVTRVASVLPLNSGNHPARATKLKQEPAIEVKLDENAARYGAAARLRRFLEETTPTPADISRLENYFGESMERNLKVLQSKYASADFKPAPWPSTYWPMFQDGLNYRWNGDEPSASEKYAKAFGKDVKEFKDAVSRESGVLSQSDSKTCKQDTDCGEDLCGIRDGESSGYCIPHWFGICHAWAPAAILEPEPQCAVEKNGVTFHVMDIKGLLTQVYDGAGVGTVFTGARYDGPSDKDAVDKFGRFTDAARRDLGPGYFHIAFSNILGKFGKSFVIDTSADAPVWNQPIRSYNVKTVEYYSPVDGARKFFDVDQYPFNDQAKKLAYVAVDIAWIFERDQDGPWNRRRDARGYV
ncbi:TPA: hypothetical protein N0F65_005999 [Lagenidium giganteum]|uniref:Uncharacterized protein n=1 Tax=Lagenidium giganteum TaxID=4803 RepID=A0AAV2Z694_9STRA|nr:TPA: hypothetical protein N0F65_005999 [Lagenidium giganteum]